MNPIITIAVQCHNFQRRFCWMLSSLAQQTIPGLVHVRVDHMAGNGNPTTENLVKEFGGFISISGVVWKKKKRFQYRGLIRNDAIKKCQTEWMMFGDCDMVYHPEYFERLVSVLREDHHKAPYMLSSGRVSNPMELANDMVDQSEAVKASQVKKAFERAEVLPKIQKRNVGAGYSQIIHMHHCPHEGYYVRPSRNKDWTWSEQGSNYVSDVQFRKRISTLGGERLPLPDWFTQNAIHLNHDRDTEVGRHLEHQR